MTALADRRLPQPHLVMDRPVSREAPPPPVSRETAPPAERTVIPDWAKILGDTTTTGEVAAKAIAIDFERAAREIETLGIELLSIAKEHDTMMGRLKEAITEVQETAMRYRQHGASLLQEIQLSSRKIAAIFEHNAQLKAALTDMDINADTEFAGVSNSATGK
jgi:hypothetical protein